MGLWRFTTCDRKRICRCLPRGTSAASVAQGFETYSSTLSGSAVGATKYVDCAKELGSGRAPRRREYADLSTNQYGCLDKTPASRTAAINPGRKPRASR